MTPHDMTMLVMLGVLIAGIVIYAKVLSVRVSSKSEAVAEGTPMSEPASETDHGAKRIAEGAALFEHIRAAGFASRARGDTFIITTKTLGSGKSSISRVVSTSRKSNATSGAHRVSQRSFRH